MNPADAVRVGKILRAHGLKGAVKIQVYGETPEMFASGMRLTASAGNGRATPETFTVRWARSDRRWAVVSFEGVDTREQAEALAGLELSMDRSLLPDLQEGTYYWSDLIGLAVYAVDDRHLGTLAAIIPTGGNDVYVVRRGDSETLVPAVEGVVVSVDLAGRTMRVDLPEGL